MFTLQRTANRSVGESDPVQYEHCTGSLSTEHCLSGLHVEQSSPGLEQKLFLKERSCPVNQPEKNRPIRFISPHHTVDLQNNDLFLKLAK